MAGLGAPELLIVAGIVVLLFGSAKLPSLARSLGSAQREFRRGATSGAMAGAGASGARSKGLPSPIQSPNR